MLARPLDERPGTWAALRDAYAETHPPPPEEPTVSIPNHVTATETTDAAALVGRRITSGPVVDGLVEQARHASATGRWGIATLLRLPDGKRTAFGIDYGTSFIVSDR